jgi:hypothetical protein
MSYDQARVRNALPVPADQYGGAGSGSTYRYWDELALNPPAGAAYAQINLLYQSTSWEYIQFLERANTGQNAFLGSEGANLLQAWLNTGMASPQVMASTMWGTPPAPSCATPGAPQSLVAQPARRAVTLTWGAGSPAPTGGYRIYYLQGANLQFRASVGRTTLTYRDGGLTSRSTYTYVVKAWNDCNGNGVFDAGIDLEGPVSNSASATAQCPAHGPQARWQQPCILDSTENHQSPGVQSQRPAGEVALGLVIPGAFSAVSGEAAQQGALAQMQVAG